MTTMKRNMSIAIAAEAPKSPLRKAVLYTAMGTTFVALAGPPCVRSHGIGKYWKALMAARRMARRSRAGA